MDSEYGYTTHLDCQYHDNAQAQVQNLENFNSELQQKLMEMTTKLTETQRRTEAAAFQEQEKNDKVAEVRA